MAYIFDMDFHRAAICEAEKILRRMREGKQNATD